MWEYKTGRPLGQGWNGAFADWIRRFGFELVADAVQKASVAGYSEHDERLPPNIADVPRYATVDQAEEREPGMRDCYFARSRMRRKFYCEEADNDVLSLLTRVMRAGVSSSAMYDAIDESNTLEDCFVALGIDRFEFRIAMGHPIVDVLPKRQIFIREEDPEWAAWNAHLRKTTGKGAPMNKHFGWYFPTRLPPVDHPPKRRTRSRT